MLPYWWERSYPYIVATMVTVACRYLKFNIMAVKGYEDLLNGLVTLDSIIIGFLGAIMPVILSMKNESKFARYVFERDIKNLFCKYLKITILLGICNVVITLLMNVREAIIGKWQLVFYYLWIFVTVAFLLTTYRSMSHMITLIFTKDSETIINGEFQENTENKVTEMRAQELKEKYKST